MKRLLEEATDGTESGVTDRERALLSSAALDVPPPNAADRLVAAVLRDAEEAIAPATEVEEAPVARIPRKTTISLAAAVAAGIAVLIGARHQQTEHARIDTDVLAPPTPQPVAQPSLEPAMTVLPPPSAAPSAVPRPPPRPSASTKVVVRPAPPSLEEAVAAAARDAGASSPPFDKASVGSVLGGVDISGCAPLRGPSGAGHLTVTFVLDGTASVVNVDPPFAGTERGACIAAKYRAVKTPPFAGNPVRVGKSFVVNASERP